MLGVTQCLEAIVSQDHHGTEASHEDSSVLGSLACLQRQNTETLVSVMHIEQVASGEATSRLELNGGVASFNFEKSLLKDTVSSLFGGSVGTSGVQ